MKSSLKILLVLSTVLTLAAVVAACGGGKKSGESTDAKIQGVWQRTTGGFLSQNTSTLQNLDYLEFSRTGAGTLYAHTTTNGIAGCASMVAAVANDTVLTLQIPGVPDYATGDTVYFFSYVRNGNTLTLSAANGDVATFTKVDAVPAASQCSAPAPTVIPLPITPYSSSGLASDGTRLYFTSDTSGAWVAFDPTTSAVTSIPIAGFSQYYLIRAAQGPNDWWMDCYCGANQTIAHIGTSGTEVDTIDTAVDLGSQIIIRAATRSSNFLWLTGDGYNGNTYTTAKILKIDSDAEPDVLVSTIPLGASPHGIAFVGTRMFVVVDYMGATLVELNPTTGAAITSFQIPYYYYNGLAAIGNKLYLIAPNEHELIAVDVP